MIACQIKFPVFNLRGTEKLNETHLLTLMTHGHQQDLEGI